MNFLSHFYAGIDYDDFTRVATLFPDIFPRFSYIHNTYFKNFDASKLDPIHNQFWKGIQIHYMDDASFHTMDSFTKYNKLIENELWKHPVLSGIKRKYLISHILYELLLDHWIINNKEDIPYKIYAIIEQFPENVMSNFLDRIIGDSTKIKLLLESYNRFSERRFLYFYTEEANLVKALHRVTGKISEWQYNESSENAFITIIQGIKNEIPYETIFARVIDNRKLK